MPPKLSDQQQRRLLRAHALQLRLGPLWITLGSRCSAVDTSLQLMYRHHPKFDSRQPGRPMSDIVATISATSRWRRWIRPQYQFYRDRQSFFLPLPKAHVPALFEWGINYCIASSCHQWLVLHGAVLAKQNQAVLLPAPSGSGKSTLAAALLCHGWRLLSDEFVIIEPTSGRLLPLPRPVSLKNQSINLIRSYSAAAEIPVVISGTNKGTIGFMLPSADSVAAQQQPVPPALVVSPRWQPHGTLSSQRLDKASALMLLADNAFNYPLWRAHGFNLLASLVEQAPAYCLEYHNLDQAVYWIERTLHTQDACYAPAFTSSVT